MMRFNTFIPLNAEDAKVSQKSQRNSFFVGFFCGLCAFLRLLRPLRSSIRIGLLGLSGRRLVGLMGVLFLLGGCASKPPVPDWQLNAKGATERFVAAYMSGNARVEAAEFDRARSDTSSTGRVDLLAKVELIRCASRVASVVFEPCAGFERLRQDAPAAERAYADYLAGVLQPQDIALLPATQRAAAAAAATGATSAPQAAGLKGSSDPLSQLVAAGVLLRTGRASPALLQQAVDIASAQGWRRPLLAWLGVQAQRAEQAGDSQEALRLRRRIELTQGSWAANTPIEAPRP